MMAFQTNEYLGGQGGACSEPVTSPTPFTDATFLTLLQTGIYPNGVTDPARAQYIEMFHANAPRFRMILSPPMANCCRRRIRSRRTPG
jgi:hypothetical protein